MGQKASPCLIICNFLATDVRMFSFGLDGCIGLVFRLDAAARSAAQFVTGCTLRLACAATRAALLGHRADCNQISTVYSCSCAPTSLGFEAEANLSSWVKKQVHV